MIRDGWRADDQLGYRALKSREDTVAQGNTETVSALWIPRRYTSIGFSIFPGRPGFAVSKI